MKRTIVFDFSRTNRFSFTRKKHISSYEFYFFTIWFIDSSFTDFVKKISAPQKPDERHKWLAN